MPKFIFSTVLLYSGIFISEEQEKLKKSREKLLKILGNGLGAHLAGKYSPFTGAETHHPHNCNIPKIVTLVFFPQKTSSCSPTVNMTPTHFPSQALSTAFSSPSLADHTLIIKISLSF